MPLQNPENIQDNDHSHHNSSDTQSLLQDKDSNKVRCHVIVPR